MATQIDVCNAALIDLGQAELLTALDDATRSARLLLARWDMSRLAVLESRPWGFARKRLQLAADATNPLFGPSARYTLPTDFVRFVADTDDPYQDYRREGNFLVSEDGAPLDIVYVADTAIGSWTPLTADALAAHLAWRIAYALTGDKGVQEDMFRLYNDALSKASMAESFSHRPELFDGDVWLRSRLQ